MVASVVFVIGALGVLGYLGYGAASLRVEERHRAAAEIAHSRLEELRTVSYSMLSTFAEEGAEVDVQGLVGARQTSVEDVDEDEDGATDYRKVMATVTWQENSRTQEVELVTLFAPTD